MSSEISFYQVDETIIKSLAPLLLKVLDEKKKVLVFCGNQSQIKEIDTSLWVYGRNKFIPHATIYDKELSSPRQPILISDKEENLNQADYLVFLSEPSADFISKFSRVFYFFEEGDFPIAKNIAKKLSPANSYKKTNGRWVGFKF